jgi:hypothetical protein
VEFLNKMWLTMKKEAENRILRCKLCSKALVTYLGRYLKLNIGGSKGKRSLSIVVDWHRDYNRQMRGCSAGRPKTTGIS